MRRIAILGALVGFGVVLARVRRPQLRERLMAHCEAMFEQMPDAFPPKKMMRGIEEIRATTNRIVDLLEADTQRADGAEVPEAASREVVDQLLEQRDKELAAIGASIDANCEPCIEHHLVAGREAGLSQTGTRRRGRDRSRSALRTDGDEGRPRPEGGGVSS